MSDTEQSHKYEFKAEIKKLLDILSKSLYQHKEIFLRELISNAVDALKKIHFISLTNKDVRDPDQELKINIILDPEINTITVSDTGVGMTKDELMNNLGTIAGSGTEKFVKKLKETREKDKSGKIDLDIIGQFGVGFYSVFMVADKVEVITQSHLKDQNAYCWTSDGTGSYNIEETEKATRGTDIVLHLKEDEEEYLESYRISNIVKKYSNFVPFPIYVEEIKEEEEEEEEKVVDVEETEEGEAVAEEEEEEPKPINQTIPLWKRSKEDITDEEYKDFYHYIARRYDDYLDVINYRVEGKVRFNSIMYIPESANRELMDPETEYGISLYSKNVMIMERCKDLMPKWMRFVKGVLESEDIPLNISRETIQSDRRIMKMNRLLVKKLIRELSKISRKDSEKYNKFWEEFGNFIKEGIVTDRRNSEKLLKLLRFQTSDTKNGKMIGLEDYVKRMPEGQEEIYYLVGESMDMLKLSPHLGYYKKEGNEVILLDKPIDNFLMMNIPSYSTKVKKDDKREEVSFMFKPIDETEHETEPEKEGEEEKEKEKEETSNEMKNFLEGVKEILGTKIIDAKTSDRLYGNPCRLANPAGGMSSSQQRAMRFWTQSQMGENFQVPRKIMEFNPDHPLVQDLVKLYNEKPENGRIQPTVIQMFENCLLSEGDLPDPTKMVPRINQLLEMLITGKDSAKNILEEQEKKKADEKDKAEEEESSTEESKESEESETQEDSDSED